MSDDRDPVRVGLIGLGNWGTYHAKQLAEREAALVGGVDVSATAREEFERAYDVDTYESYAALFEADIDAVIVTTPNKFHEEYAVTALDSGVDVLVEKPLAHTVESAERIATAARTADGFCMVGFMNRFAPGVEVLKARQRDGWFGDLTHVEANFVRRRGIPGRGSWFTSKNMAGGGSLVDIGVHAIDLALHFLGFPEVVEVSGRTRTEFGSREDYTQLGRWGEDGGHEEFDVDDSVTALLRCAEERTIALDVAWATDREPTSTVALHGTEAGATFDHVSDDLTLYSASNEGAPHLMTTEVETPTVNNVQAEHRRFFEAVREGTPPARNTVEQALTVQRVIDGIYRSTETGRAVQLD